MGPIITAFIQQIIIINMVWSDSSYFSFNKWVEIEANSDTESIFSIKSDRVINNINGVPCCLHFVNSCPVLPQSIPHSCAQTQTNTHTFPSSDDKFRLSAFCWQCIPRISQIRHDFIVLWELPTGIFLPEVHLYPSSNQILAWFMDTKGISQETCSSSRIKKTYGYDGMLRAFLQVTVPLFSLVPYFQDSFSFQLFVPLSGNHPQCMATVFGLLVQTRTFKLWKSSHTVLEKLKICQQRNKCKQVDLPHLSSFILNGWEFKKTIPFIFSSLLPLFYEKVWPLSHHTPWKNNYWLQLYRTEGSW